MTQGQLPDPGGVSRRDLLKAGALSAIAVPAATWPRSSSATPHRSSSATPHRSSSAARTGLRQPDSRPDPRRPAGTDTIPQIEHIVVVMMENHSYDNHFGMLRRAGADGFRLGWNGLPLASNPYPDGRVQHAFRMPTTCQLSGHPAQDWLASHVQYDGGRLDGFVAAVVLAAIFGFLRAGADGVGRGLMVW